jgi:hypothetical protein
MRIGISLFCIRASIRISMSMRTRLRISMSLSLSMIGRMCVNISATLILR